MDSLAPRQVRLMLPTFPSVHFPSCYAAVSRAPFLQRDELAQSQRACNGSCLNLQSNGFVRCQRLRTNGSSFTCTTAFC